MSASGQHAGGSRFSLPVRMTEERAGKAKGKECECGDRLTTPEKRGRRLEVCESQLIRDSWQLAESGLVFLPTASTLSTHIHLHNKTKMSCYVLCIRRRPGPAWPGPLVSGFACPWAINVYSLARTLQLRLPRPPGRFAFPCSLHGFSSRVDSLPSILYFVDH